MQFIFTLKHSPLFYIFSLEPMMINFINFILNIVHTQCRSSYERSDKKIKIFHQKTFKIHLSHIWLNIWLSHCLEMRI